MKQLKQYHQAVHNLCRAVCKMWGDETLYDDSYWVGGEIGGMLEISDVWLNIQDIALIAEHKIPFDIVSEWQDKSVHEGLKMNLKTYYLNNK